MKIWLDLRFLWDNIYSRFVFQLVKELIKKQEDTKFIIYTNSTQNTLKNDNSEIKVVNIKNWSLAEQTKFKKILKEDNLALTIFFNHYKPIFYKWDYIILVWDLKDLYYSNFKSSVEKYKFIYLITKNIQKADKLICLDKITKDELIERFNVKETSINIVDGFFPKQENYDYEKDIFDDEDVNVSLRTKYNLKRDYFVFSAGDSIEKNYEKLIKVFKRLKDNAYEVDLVFLGTNIWKNINLRNLILDDNLQQNIHFLGSPAMEEKKLLYRESLAVIFPSLYEPFPFRLTEPLYFWTPILASNLKKIENIFWNKINYFSPISVSSIYNEVEKFIKIPREKVDYSKIKAKYTVQNTVQQIIEIID